MTIYSLIVLALFVGMWILYSLELKVKNSKIRKLNRENDELLQDYNTIVKDYNDVVDFLEKHFTTEEIAELFLEHDMEKFIGKESGVNEKVREKVKEHLRENLDPR